MLKPIALIFGGIEVNFCPSEYHSKLVFGYAEMI